MWHEWSTLKKLIWLRRFASGASYVLKTVTGAIVHITDAIAGAVEALSVAVEPVQNLNGYDNPWPAGGGKNLLTALPSPGTLVWFCEPDGFLFKANQTYCFSISDDVTVGSYSIYAADKTTQLAYASSSRKVVYTPTVDTVGYPRLYAREGVSQEAINFAQLELGNRRTTFSPYSNICPISGWDSVTVNRTGKNLYPNSDISGTSAGVTVTHNIEDESYIVNGLSSAYRGFIASGSFTLKAGTYKISRTASSPSVSETNLRMEIRSTDGLVVYGSSHGNAFTLDSGTEVKARIVVGSSGVDFGTGITYRFQLELGSTATAYEPYNGNTYTIQLGQTVYGGTLDVVNGKMTVTWAKIVYNGSETWHPYGTQGYYISRNDMVKTTNYQRILKSDILPTYQSNYGGDFTAAKYGIVGWDNLSAPNQNYFYVKCGEVSATDQTVIKAWLQENPLTVTYELATPFELTLTPEQISTLHGTNNVWSDAGNVTMTYRASAS